MTVLHPNLNGGWGGRARGFSGGSAHAAMAKNSVKRLHSNNARLPCNLVMLYTPVLSLN